MKLMIIAILFIDVRNCFYLNEQSFKKINNENSNNDITRIVPEIDRKPTILDQFYDYMEEVREAKLIEKEMDLLRENALLKNSKKQGLQQKSVRENGKNYTGRQRRNFLEAEKSYDGGNLKPKNAHDFFVNNYRSHSDRRKSQSDQSRVNDSPNSELKFRRSKRTTADNVSEHLETTNKDLQEPMPEELEANEAYVGEPSRIHISEIKEELNKLQDLVEILRDQQYILSLLNNIDNRDDRLAKNSTRISKLNNIFHNFKTTLKSDRHTEEDFQKQEDARGDTKTQEKSISALTKENKPKETMTNSNSNLTLDVSIMKHEINQLKTIILDALRKKKHQDDTTEKEKKIASELEEQRKEVSSLKQMVIKLFGSTANDDKDIDVDSNNETNFPLNIEDSKENNRLHHMLEKLHDAEEKLNSVTRKTSEKNVSPDEIVTSTANTKFQHLNLLPKHSEHQRPTFSKNNYFLTNLFNKTARTSNANVNLHKLRTSDSDNELRSILSTLNNNKQKSDRKKELIRIQKELASLKKLTQNDGSDDSDNFDSLLDDLDIQRDDSLELISDSDIAEKLLDLEEQIKTSKKTDVHKKLAELERQIRNLNEKEDKKSRLMKLLKKIKDIPQSKSLDISDDSEDVSEKLKVLKEAIDNLQPKEDDEGVADEGKENKFGLMLQKLISGRKPKPTVTKPTSNKLQAFTNQLAMILKKHPSSIGANVPDEDVSYCKYGGLNSVYDPNQNSGNFFGDNDYDGLRPNIDNYDLTPSNFYDKVNYGNVYKKNFGNNFKNLLSYEQDYSPSNYDPNFPPTVKPYPNTYLHNKINFYDQFSPTYHPDFTYENNASPTTPYYPRPQSTFNFNSKIYPPPQRQYQQQTFNYKTGISNLFPSNLFHGPKKSGYFKPHVETQKTEPNTYATNAQKSPFNRQQNYQIQDAFTQNRINDLKKQIYNLQNIINTLHRPEYIKKPEDKITAYNLDRQITELKNVVNYLNQNSVQNQRPVNNQFTQKNNFPDNNVKYLPNGNYQNLNSGFKIQAPINDNYNSQIVNENSEEIAQEQNTDINQHQSYSNTPDASSNPPIKVISPDLPTYEDNSIHIRPNYDSVDRPSNLNEQKMSEEFYPPDGDGTRYKRAVASENLNNTEEYSAESLIQSTEKKETEILLNKNKLKKELNELIDDVNSKITNSIETDISEGFTSKMENYLLIGLEKLTNANNTVSSLISQLLAHALSNENSKDEVNKLRRRRSTMDEDGFSSELLPLLFNGNSITNDSSEESESDDAKQNLMKENPEQSQNLYDLNAVLDQLKTQLETVPRSSIARVSGKPRQPYQKPTSYYYPSSSKKMFPFFSGNKKKSKKLDVFGKIVDKILDKVIDKAPIVVFKLLHRFFGLGNLDLTTQEGNYYGGSMQPFQNFGLSGLIPMVILRMFSNLSYFISQLQRSRFLRNFLVPGLVLLGVSGMIVFLIWWLQTDNNYATQQYSYGQNSDYSSGNYYGNEMNEYGNGYNNNQYENSYDNYRNDYNTNSNHNYNYYGYSMVPHKNKKYYKPPNKDYTYGYNPYLRYSTQNLNRNRYKQNDNLYYYKNMLNKQIGS